MAKKPRQPKYLCSLYNYFICEFLQLASLLSFPLFICEKLRNRYYQYMCSFSFSNTLWFSHFSLEKPNQKHPYKQNKLWSHFSSTLNSLQQTFPYFIDVLLLFSFFPSLKVHPPVFWLVDTKYKFFLVLFFSFWINTIRQFIFRIFALVWSRMQIKLS